VISVEIERIFEERKSEMLRRCPAYRLDCLIVEELGQILAEDETFCEYAALLQKKDLRNCQMTYEYGKLLAGSPELALADMSEITQETLMLFCPGDPSLEVRWRELAATIRSDRKGFLRMYREVAGDKGDFEIMYASVFGFEAGGAGPELLRQVEKLIGPHEAYDICWWPADY